MSSPIDADILHITDFLPAEERLCAFGQLREDIPWEQHVVRLFGRSHPAPRLSSWHGDTGAAYAYSGLRLEPRAWTPLLNDLRQRISQRIDAPFNCALLNYYRDGSDSMGWHSDDEPELGRNPCIASLSLGAARRFLLRHKRRRDVATCQYLLGDGDLFVMRGTTQHNWKHQIPKTQRPVGERINITFRYISSEEDTR